MNVANGGAKTSSDFTCRLFDWLHQVNADPDLPGSALKVALQLARHFNGSRSDHVAWPSCLNIAKAIGMSEGTVIDTVRRLTVRGHLSVEPGSQGRGHSHHYRFVLKPQWTEVLDIEKPQPAKRKPQPTEQKPQPTEENYLIEPFNEPSKDHISNANDQLDGFEDWYEQYPRKVGKEAARRTYQRIIRSRKATAAELMIGAMRYAAERRDQEPRFTKHPATWLNAGCWNDEPATIASDGGGTPGRPRAGTASALWGIATSTQEDGESK